MAAAKAAQIDREEPSPNGPKQMVSSLHRAVRLQDAVIVALQQWLAALSQSDRYRRLQRDLAQLFRDQEALADRTREVGRRTLTFDLRDLPPGDAADLAAAADRQIELAQRLDRLLDSMPPLSDEALDEARRLAVGEQMLRTAEQIRQNEVGQAAAGQKQIAAALRKLSEMLFGRGGEAATSTSPGSMQPPDAAEHSPMRPNASGDGHQGRTSAEGGSPGSPGGEPVPHAPQEDIRSLLKRFWGQLPPQERGQVRQWAVEDLPPKYEALIEEYYRRLSEQEAREKR
jgi:hypothetical protein